ncbi:hypothetical protein RCH18_000269 [Flavobacterium sp. PL11]|jgi:hypothetical protein|uniref:hypothetical protein n=1 Tax=Flavobacterium sp. PL11 TaxID=3071717 RepID=UPI002E0133E8|nr:hypothetical protein [Flavobacterium sp. PL11]
MNIKIDHYTFTGGAHGYQGQRSLLFNTNTGKSISNNELFVDQDVFKAFAKKNLELNIIFLLIKRLIQAV